MRNKLTTLLASVVLSDVSFALMLRLNGPLDAGPERAGLIAMTVLSAIAIWLALGSEVDGVAAVVLTMPASVAAAWCVSAMFALEGSMYFVDWSGMSARGTDTAWMTRLTYLGIAHGLVSGVLFALVMRARRTFRASVDGPDHARTWLWCSLAIAAAASAPYLGAIAVLIALAAEIGLLSIAVRDGRRAAFAVSAFAKDRYVLGPVMSGVEILTTARGSYAGVYPHEPGRPYRGAEHAPIALVPTSFESALAPMRKRRIAAACAAVLSTAIVMAALR